MADLTQILTQFQTTTPISQSLGAIQSAPPVKTVIQNSTQNATIINQYQYLSENPKYYLSMNVGDYSRTTGAQSFTAPTISTSTGIIMPLPKNILDHYQVNYAKSPLGAVLGEGTEQFLQTQKAASSVVDSTIAAIGGGLAGVVAGTVNAILPVGAAGYAPNQFLTIMLQGPEYKQFQLSWDLSPRNVGESNRLNIILNFLKNSAAPGITLGGLYFTFPQIFQLAYWPNPQYLIKFKPAVLVDVNVSYSPTGAPAFFRGSTQLGTDQSGNPLSGPTHIGLSLTFLELEFWLKGEWRNTNSFIDVENPSS